MEALPAVVVAVAPAWLAGAAGGVVVLPTCPEASVAESADWLGTISGVFVRLGGNSKLHAITIIQTSSRVTDRPK